jgi:aquaporin Z
MINAVGDVPSPHRNPAVTYFLLARRVEGRRVLPYILSQIAGALLASFLLRRLFPAHASLEVTQPAGPAWLSTRPAQK